MEIQLSYRKKKKKKKKKKKCSRSGLIDFLMNCKIRNSFHFEKKKNVAEAV